MFCQKELLSRTEAFAKWKDAMERLLRASMYSQHCARKFNYIAFVVKSKISPLEV